MKLLAEHVGLQTWGPVGGPKSNVSGRFCDDIEWMTGRRPGLYWRVTWKFISPLLLLTIFVAYIIFLVWTTLSYKAWNPQYVGPLYGDPGTQAPWDLPRAWPGPALMLPGPDDIHGGQVYPLSDHAGCLCYVIRDQETPGVPWSIRGDSGSPDNLSQ